MPSTTAILTLLFGGVVPRLMPSGAPAGAIGGTAPSLDAAASEALARLRAGAIAVYADAPDIDFAATQARYDIALGILAGAVAQAGADRALRRVAGAIAAAAAARRDRLCAWLTHDAAPGAWVASGSSVPIRFVDSELRKDLAALPGDGGATDVVRIAILVCRRMLELARIELALGCDTQLKTLAIALVGTASDDIAELEAWTQQCGDVRTAMAAPVH
ncbi:MAG: hypothetical protein KIT36_14715 [Alphaproteobacteria bacterium]|nr:hypothetical protein [Alphaproteobacteria bacterium]